ncbi:MAG: anaerobic ribonucleoside-triphosphate reductase [Deltaproteobacteria bacterium]|nr:anaerobic ribonucleoside-triphosphate reductase [Deltaproteobacteria bacterium]
MNVEETTDITLFVRKSDEETARWNRQRIIDTLIRETGIDNDTAETISREVEKQIVASGIGLLTTYLIRELVDAKLVERGLEQARKMHARLGFSLHDARQLILRQNKENANVPHSPEGTNLILAEGIKREYALHDVFSRDVADAHAAGDIHLHALGYIDRPYSSCHSLEYVKKFGLNLTHSLTVAKPARHAEVLLAHMVRFGAMLQGHFAGVIGWNAVNLFFAPYLAGMVDGDVKQLAQMLVYEFSQLTSARGGQAIFTDIHIYWDVPEHFADVPAIGPGGEPTGRPYRDYQAEAQKFAWALFEVFKDGDATGKPFLFPRPLVHITEQFFRTPGHEDFLKHICDVAGDKGNTCFIFDRDGVVKTSCGSLNINEEGPDREDARTPWKMRCTAIQNVTINLPRLGYKTGGDDRKLFSAIAEFMDLAVKAHLQKKTFIEKLLSYGDQGPLAMLGMDRDGMPYLRMDRAIYLIGMVGLNELVRIHRGKQLHDSPDALAFGQEVISRMKAEADRLSNEHGQRFALEQSPAETTAYRFARLDLKYYSPEAGHFINGSLANGEVYYTNSTHLNVAASVTPMERVKTEGLFHSLINGGNISHVWLGDNCPSPESMAQFIVAVFRETENNQVVFSPSFTTCNACGKTSRGIWKDCPFCQATDVEGIARISQYFSRVSGWNMGKIAELRDRKLNDRLLEK